MSAVAETSLIRTKLLRTPGAMRCALCTVITQGGSKGMAEHMRACHGGRES